MAIVPSTNVNLATNIRDVLQTAGGSVGNNVTSFFKPAAKINPFSKHKPVVLAVDFCQDFDSTKPNYDEDWWKGSSGNCGLVPKNVNHYTSIPDSMDGGMNGWTYDIPDGGTTRPMRVGDFVGYYTDALPMFHHFTVPSQVTNSNTQNSITGMCMLQTSGDYYNLSFEDFPTFKNYYFGMYVKQTNGTRASYKTADDTLGNGASSVTISAYGLPEGKWIAYPFICTAAQDGVTETAGTYYTLPMNNAVEFEIVSTLVVINVFAEYNYINGVKKSVSINYITVTNRTGSSISLSNNMLQLRYTGDSLTDSPVYQSEIAAFSVANGETSTVGLTNAQKLLSLPDSSRDYYIRVTLNTSQYSVNHMIADTPTGQM